MWIPGNEMDEILQVNALSAVAKVEARKSSERDRKKSLEYDPVPASEPPEADCVVELSGDQPPEEEAPQQPRQEQASPKQDQKQDREKVEGEGDTFSDWA